MKVSVVVPVYNSEKYLSECLISLKNQTIKSKEIIIVDDASTDNSLQIAEEFQRKNIANVKLYHNDTCMGPGAARNIGIDNAVGEYIGFVDSDDYIASDMYQNLYDACINSGSEIARNGYFKIKRGFNTKLLNRDNVKDTSFHIISPQEDPTYLLRENPTCWNKLYNHSLLEKHRFNDEIKFEDYPFVFKLIGSVEKIAFSEDRKYYYRLHSNSITSRTKRELDSKHLDIFTCNDEIVRYYQEQGIYDIFSKELTDLCLIHSLSKVTDLLTVKMPFDEKKRLVNYLINLINIKYGDFENNEYYLERRRNGIIFNPKMTLIENIFLNSLSKAEHSEEEVIKKIKTL